MRRRILPWSLLGLLTLAACGGAEAPVAEEPEPLAPLAIRSALVKRTDRGELVTALRGTSASGATVWIAARETTANPDGTWAMRTDYDPTRDLIVVEASAPGYEETALSVKQPKRPKLRVSSSTGATTTADLTTLKGRVQITRGSIKGVRVTVNGAPATVVGSRWTKTVTVTKGTRRFVVRATKPGADGGQTSMTKTRKLSEAEKAERAARRKAEREAKAAAKQAKIDARRAEREAKKAAELAEEAEAESGCDPNYTGACLQIGIGDYDCSAGEGNGPNYVQGPVDVVGDDPHDLDRDSNGVGCENG